MAVLDLNGTGGYQRVHEAAIVPIMGTTPLETQDLLV